MDSLGVFFIHSDEQFRTIGISDSERWILTENTQMTYGKGRGIVIILRSSMPMLGEAQRGINREVPPAEQRGVNTQ